VQGLLEHSDLRVTQRYWTPRAENVAGAAEIVAKIVRNANAIAPLQTSDTPVE
jgi:hypothetical protein